MKVKEKNKTISVAAENIEEKTLSGAAGFFLSAFFGFLAVCTDLGGGAPLCAAAAVLSPLNGFAAFGGTMIYVLLNGAVGMYITEMIAMPAVILSKALIVSVFGRRLSPAVSGLLAGLAYFICGGIAAFAYKATAALLLALAFRGILAGISAFFVEKALSRTEQGGFCLTEENRVSAAFTYALLICMLCGISFGAVNAGRAAGAFFTIAAAYRFGCGAGGAAAALTAFAAGTASVGLISSSPILVCAGLAAGVPRKTGRHASAAAFVGLGLAGALIYGMPRDSVNLLWDMLISAGVFCFLPDRIYRKPSLKPAVKNSAAVGIQGSRMKFAAEMVSDVRENFEKAWSLLNRGDKEHDISSEVCSKVCQICRSSAFCGENDEYRIGNYFRPAEDILEKKGVISEKELHEALECCPNKNALAEAFNAAFRKSQSEKRMSEAALYMREAASEQLIGMEKMLGSLSRDTELFPVCDQELSLRVCEILSETGAGCPSAAVFFDVAGRLYIECFYEGNLNITNKKLTEKLSSVTERDLDMPEVFSSGNTRHLCFHELPVFSAEIGQASVSGRDGTSGDYGTVFRDGFGNVGILLSDGMGSGARAAVESCMTVSLMMKMMRAGLGTETAVRMINLMLMTKSAEECFSTVDLMTINLFTGKAEILKLGAAQTFIKTGGTVKTIESRSTPVGIISSVEISRFGARLSDGDEVVMITDGICEDIFPRVRELMLSMGVTAQDCAERVIAAAEKEKETSLYKQDDKTAYVVKIHKI
ncbi:MAG: SpoIIE family protein phosphatase [Oscillospiraceae bacterium]|nr:SpoIIE family protein phosphatase [Oscillospiraceae bacterium]